MDELISAAVDRFVDEHIDHLPGRLGRALADNIEGRVIFAEALREAVVVGYEARLGTGELYPPKSEEEAWDRWAAERATFDGVGEPANVPGLEAAEQVAEDAGRKLDLAGGWGGVRALHTAGRDAATAGALLAVALQRPPEDRDEVAATGEQGRSVAPTDVVRVAHAPNLPMAELLQARLLEAGIPSTRTSGPFEAYLGDSSFYEIYVARADELRALRLLEPASGPEPGAR
jgi:hypothetical protein